MTLRDCSNLCASTSLYYTAVLQNICSDYILFCVGFKSLKCRGVDQCDTQSCRSWDYFATRHTLQIM